MEECGLDDRPSASYVPARGLTGALAWDDLEPAAQRLDLCEGQLLDLLRRLGHLDLDALARLAVDPLEQARRGAPVAGADAQNVGLEDLRRTLLDEPLAACPTNPLRLSRGRTPNLIACAAPHVAQSMSTGWDASAHCSVP